MMREQKKIPFISFLDNNTKGYYKFTKIRTWTLKQLFKECAQSLLTHNFVNTHKDQLQTIYFEYQVEDEHKKWSILKRFNDFVQLKQSLHIKFHQKLLQFPINHQKQLQPQLHEFILKFFEHFLNILVQQADIQYQKGFRMFINNYVKRDKKQLIVHYQAYMKKRAGGRHNQSFFRKIQNLLSSWETKFFIITSQGIYLTQSQEDSDIIQSLIFSSTFSFLCGKAATGYQYGILINSSHRVLSIYVNTIYSLGLFVYFLHKAFSQSQISHKNKFQSFAIARNGCYSKFYIDGQDYFSDLYIQLLSAKKQIFITGWMISPFFHLKRPDPKDEYRLDIILQKISKAGIKIYIIIYNAPKLALNLQSQFTQKYLNDLSSNIKVLMHPNYLLIPFLWSHHQKMVIIDQKMAFIGGLDLGYGRYDSKLHLLNDQSQQIWYGVDYCNYRVTDITNPKQFRKCSIDRSKTPRMPWHDIGVKIQGNSVKDLCRHFIQYWNHSNFQLSMNDRELLMYMGLDQIQSQIQNSDQVNKRQIQPIKIKAKSQFRNNRNAYTQNQILNDIGHHFDFLKCHQKQQKQGDILKKQLSQIINVQNDQIQDLMTSYASSIYQIRKTKSQSKSHDQEMQFYASHLQDVSKFNEFINKLNPQKIINSRYGKKFQNVILSQNESMNQSQSSKLKKTKSKRQIHQILRSSSMWSLGLQQCNTEKSIMKAYQLLIQNAQDFIYIENQFFISKENKVTKAIYRRIRQAYKNKKPFKVVIFLPALPGFDGHPEDQNSAIFRVQIDLVQSNIKYLRHKLKEIPSIDDYLYIFSLRAHGVIKQRPVTQIIYIHSKLMIIDDKIVLVGSANINDRSLLGDRDTQIAVVIEDQQKVQLTIDGKIRLVSQFAHQLRKQLYIQHFGMDKEQALDYHNQDIWSKYIAQSKNNQLFYRLIFGCYPDNQMYDYTKLAQIQQKADLNLYEKYCKQIKGHAIPYQQKFLKKQNLELKASQKQFFLPFISFT